MSTSTGDGSSSDHHDPATTATRSQEDGPLVVHFDVNETILLSDVAGGDTAEDCRNKVLAKSAFVRTPDDGTDDTPTRWWDGSRIGDPDSRAPLYTGWTWPDGCCPYYRTAYKPRANTFTLHDGAVYRPTYDAVVQALAVDPATHVDPRLTTRDGSSWLLLPAFFHTLYTLLHVERRTHVRIVLRTFGDDLTDVARAVTAFAEGKHPCYPDFICPQLTLHEHDLYRLRWTRGGASFNLHNWDPSDPTVVAAGDRAVLEVLEGTTSTNNSNNNIILGVQDDYRHWSDNAYAPTCGKPVWIRHHGNGRPPCHHVLFDDNIHHDPDDSIVAVRREVPTNDDDDAATKFVSLSGAEVLACHERCMVRVPTIKPALDPGWFLDELRTCEENVVLHGTGVC